MEMMRAACEDQISDLPLVLRELTCAVSPASAVWKRKAWERTHASAGVSQEPRRNATCAAKLVEGTLQSNLLELSAGPSEEKEHGPRTHQR